MKQGRHYNTKNNNNKKKNTLKEITKYVTGVDEDSYSYEAEYQKIKRIRKLLKESISVVDFSNMKEEYYFIRTMIEFVYNNKNLEDALTNFKNIKDNKNKYKDKEIDITDYYIIVEALDNANVNKKYLEKNAELNNIYKLFKSIIAMQNQYKNILGNIVELFQQDEEKAINYAYEYRDTVLISTDKLNKQLFYELNKNNHCNEENNKCCNIVKVNLEDSVEEYEYDNDVCVEVDCKNQYMEDIDFSKYRDLKNVSYINLKDRFRRPKNNQ